MTCVIFSFFARVLLRHLQVMDFSDTVNRIPPEELQAAMGGGMEIPPEMLEQLEAEMAAALQAEGGLRR
eukprot:scaffold660892_cov39-Prasinocladus_malaysianus.AAC.1